MDWRQTYEFTTDTAWDDAPELRPEAVRSVLVVGDLHGNVRPLEDVIVQAVEFGAEAIVQVGDFWLADRYWSRFKPTHARYMWTAHDSPIPIIVVDGNHEVWPSLGRYARTPAADEARWARRPLHLGGSIWWAWRGSTWRWGDCAMGALGGAVSPDKHFSDVRRYRWPEEATTQDDLVRLITNVVTESRGHLDVLFTHDAPAQVRGLQSQMSGIPVHVRHEADDGRRLLAKAVERTNPAFVIHGHWHQANQERINERTEVFGLAHDGHRGSAAVLHARSAPTVAYL